MLTMKAKAGASETWDAWRQAGKGPLTRQAALETLSRELAVPLQAIRESIARDTVAEDGTFVSIDDRLSFVVWDVTENGRRCLDYDLHTGYFAALLQQAGLYLSTYARGSMKVGRISINVPSRVYVPGEGSRKLVDMPKETLEAVIERFIGYAKNDLLRWRTFGANTAVVKRALRRLEAEVLAAYEEESGEAQTAAAAD